MIATNHSWKAYLDTIGSPSRKETVRDLRALNVPMADDQGEARYDGNGLDALSLKS